MKNKLLLSITLLLLTVSYVYSQNINNQQGQNPYLGNNQANSNLKVNSDAGDVLGALNQQQIQNTQFKTVIVDKAVDKNKYIVGPNDVFSLGIYGYINQQIPLTVNIEGSIVIPTVGEVKVDGLTLIDAKNKVINAVKKRYYSSDVSFTLATPKSFLVTVSSVLQKKFEVNSTSRVSDIMQEVFYDTMNVARAQHKLNNKPEFFVQNLSMRNIEIIHKNGTKSDVDLYRYFITNNDEYNPYLKEGDFVNIPLGILDNNFVTVNGAIQQPGVYEYNRSDDLESVIGLGRGFDFNAQTDSIVVLRTDPITLKFDTFLLTYENDKKFKINVFDRVFVRFKSEYVKNFSVTVLGEVNMPGVYPITQKNTRLKDIIEMAGGMKKTAYLPLSIVFRRYDEEYTKTDTAEILINMRANDLIINEKDKLSFERDVISRRNRMVIDFDKLYNKNDSLQNIILENRDVVYINDNKNIVYVYGQVGNEGYVPFKEGASYEYYIQQAGGYSLAADESKTRIIKFNSRGWYEADKTEVLSGDFIYVPKHSPSEFKENLTIIATMIGVVASVLTTYLLIVQQNK